MKPSTRKVVTRAPARTVRILNLPGLLPGPIEAESSYEAHFVLRASLLLSCSALLGQPFQLSVSPKGYTPDYLVTFTLADISPAVIEVKPEGKVKDYADLFDSAAELLAQRGYQFYVVTDRVLFRDGIEQRVLLVRRYAKAAFPPLHSQRVTEVLTRHERGIAIGSLVRKAAVSREAILHLMARRILTTGPNLKIDDSAIVRLSAFAMKDKEFDFEHWFGICPWGQRSERDFG
jgi:hypothetical protein